MELFIIVGGKKGKLSCKQQEMGKEMIHPPVGH